MKTLVIHSQAVHGTASMKAALSILGTRVLPVPSLLLTGLTNMPGIERFTPPFEALLRGSLDQVRRREEKVLFYVGYLGEAKQVEVIEAVLDEYADHIQAVIIDPVSGDHGRPYVDEAIVAAWPRLLNRAAWALPNFTELQFYSGLPINPALAPDPYLKAFRDRFPDLDFIVTSYPAENKAAALLQLGGERLLFEHEALAQHFGGAGDIFAAFFIRYHFYQKNSPLEAMQLATLQTLEIMRRSIQQGARDLAVWPVF
jgi:pyridoxine kinase